MTPTNIRPVRPVALASEFKAWKLANGVHHPLRIEASTLPNVIAEAQGYCAHKDQFAVLECDDGKQTLRIYQIKQGKAEYRYSGGASVRMAPLKAELVAELAVEAYAPVEPWQWSRGADCVGAQRSVL